LTDRLSLYALDAFVLVDARGTTLVDTRGTGNRTPEPAPGLLAEALAGRPARGLWVDPDGTVHLAAAAPLPAGDVAAIVALESVGGGLVGELRRTTGAELVFFSGDRTHQVPGASTLPLSRSESARRLARDALAPGASP